MSNFPSQLDDDVTLPPVNDNIDETGAEAINAARDALFAIEGEIGIGASGSAGTIAARLGVSLDPAGAIKPSAIAAMGLVTLPIFNFHISDNAQITESKLKLDYRTQDLFNYIRDFSRDVNEAIGWIDITGIKLDPHIFGALYRHELSAIDVSTNAANFFKNKFNVLRNNLNAYTLIKDINDDLVQHQKADGSNTAFQNVTTFNGSVYPSNFAHLADGIFLNTSRFSTISQAARSVQDFAEFIDSQSIFLYGTRIQNFYANGISRLSRSSSLSTDGYGSPIIPPTLATTYLLNNGSSSVPVDGIDTGDDIIEFKPLQSVLDNNLFDTQFALIKPGDIIRVDYGGLQVPFVIKEKKYIQGGPTKKFIVRINGKNLFYRNGTAVARVDKPLFNSDKYGVLSVAAANNEFSALPSLIIGSPRSAVALGLGFEPQLLDSKHYILYLALFPTGHPSDGYTILPGIDVTGNFGQTPGLYTLDSVVEATNNAFRKKGFNYRFNAFQYKGEFGIMLDSFNNAGFQILNGVVGAGGTFDETATNVFFPSNVVGVFGVSGKVAPDPLGFGAFGSGSASPPFLGTYPSPESALFPAKLLLPLKRNNYYINGTEREKLAIDVGQALDGYGDGYWIAEIIDRVEFPGNRVKTSYRIYQDLSTSKIKIGKTIVVQSDGYGGLVDYGRFIIDSIAFNTCPGIANTDFSVYDSIHAVGLTPAASLDKPNLVKVYFSSDSVAFNTEHSSDESPIIPSFKRHFEVYVDQNGESFTHERARMNINGSNITINGVTLYGSSQLIPFNIVKITPKLRGYKFFSGTTSINKINFRISSYSATTGVFDGYLSQWDGTNYLRLGPRTTGRIGEVTRFYDETNVDYIDFIFEFNNSSSFTDKNMDIQLFPSLQLDEELFPIATCQVNDVTATVSYIKDIRDFGNVSEKQLTTSALSYLSSGDRLLHGNGVFRGFDVTDDTGNPIIDQIRISGGVALVNGSIVQINNTTASIPIVKEKDPSSSFEVDVIWALCINDKNEIQALPLLDQGISATNRIFLAKNPITGGTYNIDGILFSDIVNVRKDLCILYIVTSLVTGSGLSTTCSLTYKDVRRFINDQDSIIPAVVTQGKSQGNFKSINTAVNWLRFNNPYQNSLGIKGAQTVTVDPVFGVLTLNVHSEGFGASLNFSTTITETNVNFKELTLAFSSNFTATNTQIIDCPTTISGNAIFTNVTFTNKTLNVTGNATFENSTFNNCTITVGGTLTVATGNVVFNNCTINVTSDVSILNSVLNRGTLTTGAGAIISFCDVRLFTITTVTTANFNTTHFKDTTLTLNSMLSGSSRWEFCTLSCTGLANISDAKFFSCTLTFSAGGFWSNVFIDPSTITIGATVTVTNCTIKDSNVTVSVVKGFALGDGFTFTGNTVTWTGTPSAGYISGDIVNPSNGMMHADVSTTLKYINVTNNIFNTALQDHFPFFALRLTAYISTVTSVDVSGNKFISTAASNDVRAVISVVSTLAVLATSGYPRFPSLIDVHFDNNICNYDQLIIITGTRGQVDGIMFGASPVVINTTISGNICGAIGYFTSAIGSFDGGNAGSPNNGAVRNKTNKLIINDNYCKLITNLDQEGEYVCFRATVYPNNNFYEEVVSTIGEASICNNTCNWIQVGAGGYSNSTSYSGVNIIGNTVSPANPSFLANFTGHILQSVTPGNVGIMLRRENNAESLSMSTISENNIVQKYTTAADGYVQNVYYYDVGIVSLNNAKITNNNFFGVINSKDNVYMYIWSQNISLIMGNVFRRGYNSQTTISTPNLKLEPTTNENQYMDNLPCYSYIYTNLGSSNKRSLISNNIFHDQNVNSASEVSAGRDSGNLVIANPSGSGIIIKNNVVNQTYFTTGIGTGVGN